MSKKDKAPDDETPASVADDAVDDASATKDAESATTSQEPPPKQSSASSTSNTTRIMTIRDLGALRLSQDHTAGAGVKALTQIPVRKPNKQIFIRTHPDEAYWFDTKVLELKEEGETYLVVPQLWEELYAELVATTLILCVSKQGVISIWPVRLPDDMGKTNAWHQSAREAAVMATSHWIRVVANMQLGGYEVVHATNNLATPAWPDKNFHELLDIAFRDRFIDRIDHPVLRRMRGEI